MHCNNYNVIKYNMYNRKKHDLLLNVMIMIRI